MPTGVCLEGLSGLFECIFAVSGRSHWQPHPIVNFHTSSGARLPRYMVTSCDSQPISYEEASYWGYKSKNLFWFSWSDFEFHEWTAKACYRISSYILEQSMKKIKWNYLFSYSRCSMNSKSYSRRILTDIFAQLQTQIQSVIQLLFSMCDRQFSRVKAETVHV